MIPSYLLSGTGCERGICAGCANAVKINPATGRWFITMGHPGFNSPTNNRDGYSSAERAKTAIKLYRGKTRRAPPYDWRERPDFS